MEKKYQYKIVTFVADFTIVISECGKLQMETEDEKQGEKKPVQISLKEFCEAHGITIKEGGFSCTIAEGNRQSSAAGNGSREEKYLIERLINAKKMNEMISLREAADFLTGEDREVISMFVTDEDAATIRKAEGADHYEEFDLCQFTEEGSLTVSKKILHKDKMKPDFEEIDFSSRITEVHMERLRNGMDCMVVRTEFGGISRVFYTDEGETIWRVEQ